MDINKNDYTPAASPNLTYSPLQEANLGGLSLKDSFWPRDVSTGRDGSSLNAPLVPSKRATCEELARGPDRQCAGSNLVCTDPVHGTPSGNGRSSRKARKHSKDSDHTGNVHIFIPTNHLANPTTDSKISLQKSESDVHSRQLKGQDRAYGSGQNIGLGLGNQATAQSRESPESRHHQTKQTDIVPTTWQGWMPNMGAASRKQTTIITVSQKARWPGLILQPDSSAISEEQLTAEIKGIYAGLVIVEAKCINIDNVQASELSIVLDPSQW